MAATTQGLTATAMSRSVGEDRARGAYATARDGTDIYFELFSPEADGPGRRCATPEGVPPALLVMGLAANGRLWSPFVRRLLAAGYEAIVVDNRGCGRSSTPRRPWTTRTMADDAVAVLDELGVERVHVGGVSLGGMVAQEIALAFPERVSTLVLSSTTAGFRRPGSASPKGLSNILQAGWRSLRAGDDPDREVSDFLCTVASKDFAAQCRPGEEIWDTVAAMLEDPASQRGVALQMLAGMRHSTWSRLPRLRMPVQVHHGEQDPLIPPAAGRELARRIPGARFELYPGSGHGILERIAEVSDCIHAFLAESDARSTRAANRRG